MEPRVREPESRAGKGPESWGLDRSGNPRMPRMPRDSRNFGILISPPPAWIHPSSLVGAGKVDQRERLSWSGRGRSTSYLPYTHPT